MSTSFAAGRRLEVVPEVQEAVESLLTQIECKEVLDDIIQRIHTEHKFSNQRRYSPVDPQPDRHERCNSATTSESEESQYDEEEKETSLRIREEREGVVQSQLRKEVEETMQLLISAVERKAQEQAQQQQALSLSVKTSQVPKILEETDGEAEHGPQDRTEGVVPKETATTLELVATVEGLRSKTERDTDDEARTGEPSISKSISVSASAPTSTAPADGPCFGFCGDRKSRKCASVCVII